MILLVGSDRCSAYLTPRTMKNHLNQERVEDGDYVYVLVNTGSGFLTLRLTGGRQIIVVFQTQQLAGKVMMSTPPGQRVSLVKILRTKLPDVFREAGVDTSGAEVFYDDDPLISPLLESLIDAAL